MKQRFTWTLLAGLAVSTFVGGKVEAAPALSADSLSDGRVVLGWTDPTGTLVLERLDLLAGNALPAAQWDTQGLRAAGDQWRAVLEELLIRGWRQEGDGLVYGLTEASAFVAPAHGSALFPARSHYYRLIDLETGFEQVGRLTPDGLLPPLILRPEAFYAIAYVDPETFATGAAFFLSARAGRTTVVPTAPLPCSPAPNSGWSWWMYPIPANRGSATRCPSPASVRWPFKGVGLMAAAPWEPWWWWTS